MNPKMPPPPQDPVPQLIDNLLAAGVPAEEGEAAGLKLRFARMPYKAISVMPCVTYDYTDPFRPSEGKGMTVHFTPSVVPFEYTVVVIDISVDPSVVVYSDSSTYGTSPASVDIPAYGAGANPIFIDGHEYIILLYPSFTALHIPIGCVTSVVKSTKDKVFTLAVFAGCEFAPAAQH